MASLPPFASAASAAFVTTATVAVPGTAAAAAATAARAVPTLPQHDGPERQAQRAFQLAMARTDYNYMRSYLDAVPMSADLPAAERFSLDYIAQVLRVIEPLLGNFKRVVAMLLERELQGDLPSEAIHEVASTWEALERDFSVLHPVRDAERVRAFLHALSKLPRALENVANLPRDIEAMIGGLDAMFKEMLTDGPTAFLKSTLYDMLGSAHGRAYLHARSEADYAALFDTLPTPLSLSIARQPWMPAAGKPSEQDWFFGHLQVAGFNTTQLRGVVPEAQAATAPQAVTLAALQRKLPLTDAILQRVTGRAGLTLEQAVREGHLYVVDYAALDGAKTNPLHGEARYICAPVAVFYWNDAPPPGFPPDGALQPVAIQLAQAHDPEHAPVFTPNDCAGAQDPNGLKWALAKYIVNVCGAIQHEAVAHLGDTHLIVEPMIVAAHRQLAVGHPLLKLLEPHFRFTININDDAIHSLIVPGGVVACNVGIAIESSLAMVTAAHRAWRWDDNVPTRLFALRGVDRLPQFAFRDDTLLLWRAIHDYVGAYLRVYYRDDADVAADSELQGWIHELTAPQYCGFQGLRGLQPTGDTDRPWRLASLDYLVEMVALVLYTAGPQHASVNYAQYPLMSYVPSVAGSIYRAPPTRSTVVAGPQDLLAWYPPLDIALYGASFEFLLSQVQFDTFGRYEHNPREPWFTDARVQPLVADLQDALALIEIEIRRRNAARPMPYPWQLPSQIPNSISI